MVNPGDTAHTFAERISPDEIMVRRSAFLQRLHEMDEAALEVNNDIHAPGGKMETHGENGVSVTRVVSDGAVVNETLGPIMLMRSYIPGDNDGRTSHYFRIYNPTGESPDFAGQLVKSDVTRDITPDQANRVAGVILGNLENALDAKLAAHAERMQPQVSEDELIELLDI